MKTTPGASTKKTLFGGGANGAKYTSMILIDQSKYENTQFSGDIKHMILYQNSCSYNTLS